MKYLKKKPTVLFAPVVLDERSKPKQTNIALLFYQKL